MADDEVTTPEPEETKPAKPRAKRAKAKPPAEPELVVSEDEEFEDAAPEAEEDGVLYKVSVDPGSASEPASGTGGSPISTPAVPATTVTATNSNAVAVFVTITGGTLTSVKVNGVQVGTTAGTYTVPAGQTISITYSVAPTWVWYAPVSVDPGSASHAPASLPGV